MTMVNDKIFQHNLVTETQWCEHRLKIVEELAFGFYLVEVSKKNKMFITVRYGGNDIVSVIWEF